MKSIAIVGGGIGGLATAFRLREHAKQTNTAVSVTVYEAGARLGGVIASSHEQGFTLEHGPDSIVRSKPAGIQLIHDLGLDEALQPTQEFARSSLIVKGRRLLPIPEGLYLLAPAKLWPFALSPIISWPGKLRMALDFILPRRRAGLPEESLAEFVRRRLGREALERIAQPLVSGIYTADPEQLSLRATMPQFLDMEREHRSLIKAMRHRAKDQAIASARGPRYGLFTSLNGGLQTLVDRLVDRLKEPGCDLALNTKIDTILRAKDGGYTLSLAEGYRHFDQVVVALPAHAAAKLTKSLDDVLSYKLATIPYAGVVTVNVALRANQVANLPIAAGFVVPAVEGRSLIACTFGHHKYANRAPVGHVLLRAFVGGALNENLLDRSDSDLVGGVLRDLRDLLGVQGDPLFTRVHRWPKAMAQYVLGHQENVQVIRARERELPGFALVGNGYEGVGIPDLAAQAESAVDRLTGRDRSLPKPVHNELSRSETI